MSGEKWKPYRNMSVFECTMTFQVLVPNEGLLYMAVIEHRFKGRTRARLDAGEVAQALESPEAALRALMPMTFLRVNPMPAVAKVGPSSYTAVRVDPFGNEPKPPPSPDGSRES